MVGLTLRVLTILSCRHLLCVLLKVTFIWVRYRYSKTMGNTGPLLVTPLFLSNFIQTIIMFFDIVGQGFTLGYCGRQIAQLLSTCFFVLQF